MSDTDFIVVFVTCARKEADSIARILIDKKLAACVNLFPVVSHYYWQGKARREDEILLIIKTRRALYQKLESEVKQAHSYEVPEIIAVNAEAVEANYMKWLLDQTAAE